MNALTDHAWAQRVLLHRQHRDYNIAYQLMLTLLLVSSIAVYNQ
jgi:hypothetical protein